MKEIGFKGGGSSTNDFTNADKAKLASTVMKVNNTSPDANGNINVNTLTDAEYTALNAAVQTVEGSAAKLTELEGKVGELSVVDGSLCMTFEHHEE